MRFQSLERLFERSASNSAIVCPSTPAAPWLAFTRLNASQTSRFGMSNGFALLKRLLPSLVDRLSGLKHHSPFGPAPLQCLHPYYELFCPCAPHRYSEPREDRS